MFLGIALLLGLQRVLSKKWVYPSFQEDTAYGLSEFYQLAGHSGIETVFLGSSHVLNGVDPMAIYECSGIATYNLGTTGQPIETSQFLLSEILERRRPQVVMLDIAMLYHDTVKESSYRAVLDNAPLSLNKLKLAWEYALHDSGKNQLGSLLGVFLPIFRYHDRWTELSAVDFAQNGAGNFYRKGYYFTARIDTCSTSIEWMNEVAEIMHQNVGWTHSYIDGMFGEERQEDALYEPSIGEAELKQLKQMKQMCDENGVKLVLMKIPSVGDPPYYSGAWTRLRSVTAKKMAAELGLDFLDLFYDVDLGIDWTRDFADNNGAHLNFLGASKVSAFLGMYLKQQCGLTAERCEAYEEDIPSYRAMCGLAQLQTTNSLADYLDALRAREHITVFCSAYDDMMINLTRESRDALKRIGFQTDFDDLGYSDAFLAVVENGEVRSEMSSNRRIADEGTLNSGCQYEISSSGWLTEIESNILLNSVDYSMKHRGINIVVLDNASGLVLDSVAFDTWDVPENQSAIRDNANTEKFLREYERHLMIQDRKNGIGA